MMNFTPDNLTLRGSGTRLTLLGLAPFLTQKAPILALTNGMKKQHLGLSEKQHERNASSSTQSPVLYGQR
jgi:hypothetical protein